MAAASDDKLKQFQAALAELQVRFKNELPARLAGIRAQIETFVTEALMRRLVKTCSVRFIV